MHDYRADKVKLTLVRCAKHANFKECDSCSTLRKAWLKLARDSQATPAAVDAAYDAFYKHHEEWRAEREEALTLKFESSSCRGGSVYQGDDKCGSHWLQLPVDPTGRDSKSGARSAYQFGIQGNVVPGEGGLQRFAVVPKSIRTGGNFGLMNLLLALERAQAMGRLQQHVTRLIRHTDGGPDTVSWVTHAFHWLLVYIGAFQEVLWFRFEAGHSHTELVDRLFALMKRLFEGQAANRALGMGDMLELWRAIKEEFKDCKEDSELVFDMGNGASSNRDEMSPQSGTLSLL